MKLNKRKLRQVIRREIDTMLQEGMLDSVLGSQFNPLRGMVDQRPAPPMVKRGELGRFFEDPKEVFESLKNDYPFIEVNNSFAFVPDWAYDIGPGGLEGGSPGDDVSYAIEGMAIEEEHVDFPEPGTRYYFLHQDGQPTRDYVDLSGGDGRGGIPRQRSRYNLYENDNSLGNPGADKVQDLLNYMGYQYKVKELPYMSGRVNPFDEFNSTVIGTLEKAGMYDENVYYVDTGKDFRAADAIQGLIADVVGPNNTLHSSSGGFLGRTVFFRG